MPPRIGGSRALRILLVEDDGRMRSLVRRGLTEHGHVVDVAVTGPEALALGGRDAFDVLVLDVMLPECSGVDVIRQLRSGAVCTPALMLTAKDSVADVVASLDAGADDYLTKPFSFAVLLARIRALGRRSAASPAVRLAVADLVLDVGARTVCRRGLPVGLTCTEFNLLERLMRRAGRVVTRQALVDHAWGTGRAVEANRSTRSSSPFARSLITGDGRA